MRKGKILVLGLVLALSLALIAGCSAPDNNEGYDNGYEVGISETDHIVNTTATDKVILVVSFGTSYNQSRNLTIGGIETAIQNAYPNYQVRRAFTSQIIIDKLAKREGLVIDNVTEAMNRLLLDKVKEVIVQPTTVMNGFEYEDMIKEVMPFADKFDSLKIGKWLLADEADYDEVSELIVKETAKFRADDTALVFMGHGTEHEARATYVKLQAVLTAKGYHDYIIGTVERGIEIDQVREQLSQMDISRVVLRPLMVVAGDHANNDMAGAGEDSWRTILEEDGYMVETVLEGLGQIEGIQDIYIRHLQEAIAGDPVEAVPAATAAGVTAARIQNGSYSIEVDSDTAMFKIVDCQLTVEDEQMMAAITLSGRGYSALYMGKGAEAAADEANQISPRLQDDKHTFTVPVAALDIDLDCAGQGSKSGNWYDHLISFKSENIPEEAFIPAQVRVEMSGGAGKASIESPATLLYRRGTNVARIVWSSPNYTYLSVEGVKYMPLNREGNSSFEIPIEFDLDLPIKACTVAMSTPKEIEYDLRFDSASIQ